MNITAEMIANAYTNAPNGYAVISASVIQGQPMDTRRVAVIAIDGDTLYYTTDGIWYSETWTITADDGRIISQWEREPEDKPVRMSVADIRYYATCSQHARNHAYDMEDYTIAMDRTLAAWASAGLREDTAIEAVQPIANRALDSAILAGAWRRQRFSDSNVAANAWRRAVPDMVA